MTSTRIVTTAAMLAGAAALAAPALAGETEYGGTFCGRFVSTMLQGGPEIAAFNVESWGIETPDSTFRPWAGATNHCAVNVLVLGGKATERGQCVWTDADGDTFIGSFLGEADKPGAWTFLGGTGKWKGVSGGGTYQHVSASRPRADGTGENCTTHSGKYMLP